MPAIVHATHITLYIVITVQAVQPNSMGYYMNVVYINVTHANTQL